MSCKNCKFRQPLSEEQIEELTIELKELLMSVSGLNPDQYKIDFVPIGFNYDTSDQLN